MEIMQPLGYVKIFGIEFYVFKVVGAEIYYYEDVKTGKISKIDLGCNNEF